MKKISYLLLALLFINISLNLGAQEKLRQSQINLYEQIKTEKTKEEKQQLADYLFEIVKDNMRYIYKYWTVIKENPEYKSSLQPVLDYYLNLYEIQAFEAPYKKSEILKSLKEDNFIKELVKDLYLFQVKVKSMIEEGEL